MSFRPIKIDEALRADHYYLEADDDCYCLGEYHPRAGYSAGPVNSLISNFKKSVTKRGLPEYNYKEQSILRVGQLVREALSKDAPSTTTFVPVPPSKAKNDPLYDDRMVRALNSGQPTLDVRELLVMQASTRAHHEHELGQRRPTPDDLYALLAIDQSKLNVPVRSRVILVDDVLTNGTHFKACKRLILDRIGGVKVIGLFIGRTKRPVDDLAAIFGPVN